MDLCITMNFCVLVIGGFLGGGAYSAKMDTSTVPGYVQLDAPSRNVTRYEGETVRLRCEITGSPLPGYRWYHNGQLLGSDAAGSAGPAAGTSGPRRDSRTVPWGCRMKIDDLTVADSGWYKCEGFNLYGHQTTNGYLHVIAGPNPNPTPSHDKQAHNSDGDSMDGVHVVRPGDDLDLDSETDELEDENEDETEEIETAGVGRPGAAGARWTKMDDINSHKSLTAAENHRGASSSCPVYRGVVCASVIGNGRVYIPNTAFQANKEKQLIAVFTTMAASGELSTDCSELAMALLCRYAFRPCDVIASSSRAGGDVIAEQRDANPGRRPVVMCRQQCERLEEPACRDVYELAKQHIMNEYKTTPGRCDRYPDTLESCIGLDRQQQRSSQRPIVAGGTQSPDAATSTTVYIIAACVGTVVVLAVVIVAAQRCQHRFRSPTHRSESQNSHSQKCANMRTPPRKHQLHRNSEPEEDQSAMLLPAKPCFPAAVIPGSFPIDVPLSAVRIIQRVGEGAFGTVYVGEVASQFVSSNRVIVKTLSGGADIHTRSYFAERTQVTIGLKHGNVLAIVGACLQAGASGTISALYEHFDGIDLHSYLQREQLGSSSDRTNTALQLARDISAGMEYLAIHGWVHGDLASRNVLVVSQDNSPAVTAKVCDLALASPWFTCTNMDMSDPSLFSGMESNCSFPVARVVAPEVLIYGPMALCEASDVWSFGVLLWEMFSSGGHVSSPPDNYATSCVTHPTQRIECPSAIVALVSDYCHEMPNQRPLFRDIHSRLLGISRARSDASGSETGRNRLDLCPISNQTSPPVSAGGQNSCSPATSNDTAYTILSGQLTARPTCTSPNSMQPMGDENGERPMAVPQFASSFCRPTQDFTPNSGILQQRFYNDRPRSNEAEDYDVQCSNLAGRFVL